MFAGITFILFRPIFSKRTVHALGALLTVSVFGSAFLTDIVIKRGSPCIVEGNPSMRWIICRYGVMGMWVSKTAILVVILLAIWIMYLQCEDKNPEDLRSFRGVYLWINVAMFVFLWAVWTNLLDLIVDIILF